MSFTLSLRITFITRAEIQGILKYLNKHAFYFDRNNLSQIPQ